MNVARPLPVGMLASTCPGATPPSTTYVRPALPLAGASQASVTCEPCTAVTARFVGGSGGIETGTPIHAPAPAALTARTVTYHVPTGGRGMTTGDDSGAGVHGPREIAYS